MKTANLIASFFCVFVAGFVTSMFWSICVSYDSTWLTFPNGYYLITIPIILALALFFFTNYRKLRPAHLTQSE